MKQKYIYFALAEGIVKIGSSINPERRIRTILSPRRPAALLVHFPGDHKVEYGIHTHFSKDCLNLEWFKYSRRIRRFIEEVSITVYLGHKGTILSRCSTAGRGHNFAPSLTTPRGRGRAGYGQERAKGS